MSSLAVSQTHTLSSRMNSQRNWGRFAVTLCRKMALGSIISAPRVSLRLTSHSARLVSGSALPSSSSSGNSNDNKRNHGNEFMEIGSKFKCINYRYSIDKAHEILESKVEGEMRIC